MSKLKPQDVVRINVPEFRYGQTGVVHRICSLTGGVCVFPKHSDIGVWFRVEDLKRIGSTKRKETENE